MLLGFELLSYVRTVSLHIIVYHTSQLATLNRFLARYLADLSDVLICNKLTPMKTRQPPKPTL